MSFLRRFVLILYGLALLALVTLMLMFPIEVARAIESLNRFGSLERGIAAFVVDVLILLALYLLVRQVRPYSKDGLMVKASGALTDVSVESARERIVRAINGVPNVVSTDAKLQSVNGRADIELDVGVAGAHINVPDKQREIDRALRQVMLKQLGLQLAHAPRVHIQLLSEQELAPRREETPRPPILPPASAEPARPLPDEERAAVQVTPPADALAPTFDELAAAPDEAELWAAMRPTSEPMPPPASETAVHEALVEDAGGVIAGASEPKSTIIEEDAALPWRKRHDEPVGEWTASEAVPTDQSDVEEERSYTPIDPAIVDNDVRDDADLPDDESSERPSMGLYDEEGDLRSSDSDRRPPSTADLD